MASLTSEQRQVLAAFKQEARRQGASPKEIKALIEAGLVESGLRNLPYGDRDSIGSLQERSHYGPTSRRLNPTLAARRFLTEAKGANRPGTSAGQLAQSVQRSAFPGRYDQQSGQAAELLGALGKANPTTATTTATTPGVDRSRERAQLISQFLSEKKADPVDLALGIRQLQDTPGTTTTDTSRSGATSAPRSAAKGGPVVDELFYDPLGGWKNGQSIGPIGGHADHVHVGVRSHGAAVAIARRAQKMGLSVRELEPFDKVDPVHTQGSEHYEGRAFDASGDPGKQAALVRWIQKRYGLKS